MKSNGSTEVHTPVMVEETMELLDLSDASGGTYIDATVGTGGHSREICRRLGPEGRLVGIDKDRDSLQTALDRLSKWEEKVELYHVNFDRLPELVRKEGIEDLRGVLFDLGFSSYQLSQADRGFSFKRDGPLDMRMDKRDSLTAEKVVNEYSSEELVRTFQEYGEERYAGRIAREIEKRRKEESIESTEELADIIREALPSGYGARRRIDPATKAFQALRIEVNKELENLREGLEGGFRSLQPGGRMVVISYHSLEDRIVKRFMKEKEKECLCPPELPVCRCDKSKEAEILTDGPVRPKEEEVEENPRSRSGLLRAVSKV